MIPAAQHGLAAQDLCPHATEVVRQLQQAGHEAYIVGGSVRDLLLGKIPKDFDVATDATPEEVKKVFPRCLLIGRRFRLAHVRLRGVLVEVATFRGSGDEPGSVRTEKGGRILRDNAWGSLEEDARRRDFTINALFMDPVTGDIADFVGGYEDLADRRLRLIGDPETRYREDPVRLLRAARFVAKLGVEPHPATGDPVSGLAPLLEDIPPARLFEEVCKLFLTGHAVRTMEALQRFGLTCVLFPLMQQKGAGGKAVVPDLLWAALANTDERVSKELSVTPAFLYAALLWEAVLEAAAALQERGQTEIQAIQQAGEQVILKQVRRTALPRRFGSVTRDIWTMQVRLKRTRGKRAMRSLQHPKFRAAYDFLLLRAEGDPALAELAAFWTEAQKEHPPAAQPSPRKRAPRKRRRGGRRRGGKARNAGSA